MAKSAGAIFDDLPKAIATGDAKYLQGLDPFDEDLVGSSGNIMLGSATTTAFVHHHAGRRIEVLEILSRARNYVAKWGPGNKELGRHRYCGPWIPECEVALAALAKHYGEFDLHDVFRLRHRSLIGFLALGAGWWNGRVTVCGARSGISHQHPDGTRGDDKGRPLELVGFGQQALSGYLAWELNLGVLWGELREAIEAVSAVLGARSLPHLTDAERQVATEVRKQESPSRPAVEEVVGWLAATPLSHGSLRILQFEGGRCTVVWPTNWNFGSTPSLEYVAVLKDGRPPGTWHAQLPWMEQYPDLLWAMAADPKRRSDGLLARDFEVMTEIDLAARVVRGVRLVPDDHWEMVRTGDRYASQYFPGHFEAPLPPGELIADVLWSKAGAQILFHREGETAPPPPEPPPPEPPPSTAFDEHLRAAVLHLGSEGAGRELGLAAQAAPTPELAEEVRGIKQLLVVPARERIEGLLEPEIGTESIRLLDLLAPSWTHGTREVDGNAATQVVVHRPDHFSIVKGNAATGTAFGQEDFLLLDGFWRRKRERTTALARTWEPAAPWCPAEFPPAGTEWSVPAAKVHDLRDSAGGLTCDVTQRGGVRDAEHYWGRVRPVLDGDDTPEDIREAIEALDAVGYIVEYRFGGNHGSIPPQDVPNGNGHGWELFWIVLGHGIFGFQHRVLLHSDGSWRLLVKDGKPIDVRRQRRVALALKPLCPPLAA